MSLVTGYVNRYIEKISNHDFEIVDLLLLRNVFGNWYFCLFLHTGDWFR